MKKFKFSIDNNPFEVAVTELENGQIDVEVNGSNYIVTIDREGTKAANAPAPKAEPAAAPAAGGPAKALKSPLPGSITKILVTAGQAVKKGETLLMMEAMKMENEIKAEKDGVVAEIKVTVGQNVMNDDVLLTIA